MSKQRKDNQTEQEFYESPEVLAEKLSKTEEIVEKNKFLLFGLLAVVALAIGGYFFYGQSQEAKNQEAVEEAFQAQYYYEADSLNKALNGDGNHLGFLDIIDEYGSTKIGNLSNFYVGTIYLKQGDFESAVEYLKQFSSSDALVQSRAYALTGDAYMELKDFDEAAAYYTKAAEYKANEQFSPIYWTKAAIAYEKLGDLNGASESYDMIVSEYPKSRQFTEARKQLARVKSMTKG